MKNSLIKIHFVIILLAFPFITESKSDSKKEKGLPPKVEVYQSVKGDLNQDGNEDEVIIKTECGDCFNWEAERPPNLIVELYLSSSVSKTLELAESSVGAVCYRCGGMKGKMIVGRPEVTKKGILNMIYFGGSRFVWDDIFKWRWNKEKKSFELIGRTLVNTDTLSENGKWDSSEAGTIVSMDVNYMSRKSIIKYIGTKNKVIKTECKLSEKYKTPRFSEFVFEKFEDGASNCIMQKSK